MVSVHFRHFDIADHAGNLIQDISAEFLVRADVIPCVLAVVEVYNILISGIVQRIYDKRIQERGVLRDNNVL